MPTDLERLVVSLEARVDKYTKEVNRAVGITGSATKGITRQFDDMGRAIERRSSEAARRANANFQKIGAGTRFSGLLRQGASTLASRGPASAQFVGSLMGGSSGLAIGVAAGTAAVAAFGIAAGKAGEEWLALGNRLRAAGVASKDLAEEQAKVAALALAGHADLEATNDLYVKFIGVTKTLGRSQEEAGVATKAVTQALSLGGVSAGAAAGAITQLGQALGSGVLRGDEFNSVMEALGAQSPIIQAIAREFGVTTDKLRGLAEAGDLVAGRVFKAIIDAAADIDSKATGSIITLSQALTDLKTAATQALAALGGTALITNTAKELEAIAKAINAVAAARDRLVKASQDRAAADADTDAATRVKEVQNQIEASEAKLTQFHKAIQTLQQNPLLDPGGIKRLERAVSLEERILETLKLELMVAKGIVNARKDATEAAEQQAAARPDDDREARNNRALLDMTTQSGRVQGVIEQRNKELAETERQKDIDKAADTIIAAMKKAGANIDDAARDLARKQAEKEVDAAAATKAAKATNEGLFDGLKDTIDRFVDRVIKAESGGNPTAKSETSSAAGLGQFINDTWVAEFKKAFKSQAGLSREAILAKRTDPEISKEVIRQYAKTNAELLKNAGIAADKIDEAALHLAHFLGAGDAAKVLKAAPGTPLRGLIDPDSIAANQRILGGGKTVDDALAYARKRANDTRVAAGDFNPEEKRARSLAEILKAEQDDTAAILRKTEALTQSAGVADLETEKVKLRNEAVKAGIELTPEVIAALDKEAEAHAKATQAGEDHQKALEQLKAAQEEVRGLAGDFLGSFVSGLMAGKSAADALRDALGHVLERLAQMAEDELLNGLFGKAGGAGGGLLSGLFKLLGFDTGGWTGNGGEKQPAGVVHGQEFVVKAGPAKRNRAMLEAMNRGLPGYAGGGFVGLGAPGLPSITLPQLPRLPSFAGMGRAGRGPVHLSQSISLDLKGAIGDKQLLAAVRQQAEAAIQANNAQLPALLGEYEMRNGGR